MFSLRSLRPPQQAKPQREESTSRCTAWLLELMASMSWLSEFTSDCSLRPPQQAHLQRPDFRSTSETFSIRSLRPPQHAKPQCPASRCTTWLLELEAFISWLSEFTSDSSLLPPQQAHLQRP